MKHKKEQRNITSVSDSSFSLGWSLPQTEGAVVIIILTAPGSMYLHPLVLHIWPLLPSGYLNCENSDDTRVGTSIWAEYDCLAWKDSNPIDLVIYISFGSLIHVSKAQLEEIATGLKESRQPFLWVLRPDIVASMLSDFLRMRSEAGGSLFHGVISCECYLIPQLPNSLLSVDRIPCSKP